MSNNQKVIAIYLSSWVLFYLIGCFASAHFAISNWSAETRGVIATLVGFATVGVIVLMLIMNVNPPNDSDDSDSDNPNNKNFLS